MDDLEDFEFAVAERFPTAFSRLHPTVVGTPRELVDHLSAQASSQDQRSLKQHSFYFIRALFAQQLHRDRRQIHPSMRLGDLMPDPLHRRETWKVVCEISRIHHFPRLHRSAVLGRTLKLFIAMASFAAFYATGVRFGSNWALVAGLTVAAVLSWLSLRATENRATLFLPSTLTVGDLAAYATAYGSKNPRLAIEPSTRSHYLEIVRDMVRLEIGATPMNEDATWEELSASARCAS